MSNSLPVVPAEGSSVAGVILTTQALATLLGSADDALICQQVYLDTRQQPRVQRSYTDWAAALPWLSLRTVKRRLADLREAGALVCTEDRSGNWWALSAELLALGQTDTSMGQIDLPGQNGTAAETAKTVTGEGFSAGGDIAAQDAAAASVKNQSYISNTSSVDKNVVSKFEENVQSKTGAVKNQSKTGSSSKTDKKNQSTKQESFYTWEHYEWTPEIWKEIREEGILPERETRVSVAIGAYLLLMHRLHERVLPVSGSHMRGKLGRQVKESLEHFTFLAKGDEVAGLRAALDYVKWYCEQTESTWLAQTVNRALDQCFTPRAYAEIYGARTGKKVVTEQELRRKGSLARNDGVGVVHSAEERRNLKSVRF